MAQSDLCAPIAQLDRVAATGFTTLRGADVQRALPPSGGPILNYTATAVFAQSAFARVIVRSDRPPYYLAGFSGGHVGGVNAFLARIDACRLHADARQITRCEPDKACERQYRFASGAVMDVRYAPDTIDLQFNAPAGTARE